MSVGGGGAFVDSGNGTITSARLPDTWAWWDWSIATSLAQDSAGTTPIAANGDPIGYVADQSGNERHLLQTGAATTRLTYTTNVRNGLSAASFDGGDYLDTVATVTSSPLSFMGVAITGSTVGTIRGLVSNTHSLNGGSRIRFPASNALTVEIGLPLRSATGGTVAANTAFIFCGRYDAASFSVTLDSTTVSNTHTVAPVSNIVSVGRLNINSTSNLFNGYLCELLVFDRVISTNEVTSLRNLLNSKWAVY